MAAQASLLKQMGLTLRESDMIVRVGGQEIGDDTFPCDSLPQESLEIGLKTRRFVTIEDEADSGAGVPMLGGPAFAGSNAATQTMLNKFKVVAKKGADIDAQVRQTADDAIKQIDVLLECYTRAILDLDDVRPRKTDPAYTETISRRNSEIARVKAIQAALNASKASYVNVKKAAKSDVFISVHD